MSTKAAKSKPVTGTSTLPPYAKPSKLGDLTIQQAVDRLEGRTSEQTAAAVLHAAVNLAIRAVVGGGSHDEARAAFRDAVNRLRAGN